MATFSIRAMDKPNSALLRAATRPVHLEHLARHAQVIVAAGAVLDDQGVEPTGSLLIVEMASAYDAIRFMDADPYFKAGLFADVEVKPIRMVYPRPTGRSTVRND